MGCIGSKDDGNNAHLRKPMPMALFGAGGKERLQGLKEHHIVQMRELGAVSRASLISLSQSDLYKNISACA